MSSQSTVSSGTTRSTGTEDLVAIDNGRVLAITNHTQYHAPGNRSSLKGPSWQGAGCSSESTSLAPGHGPSSQRENVRDDPLAQHEIVESARRDVSFVDVPVDSPISMARAGSGSDGSEHTVEPLTPEAVMQSESPLDFFKKWFVEAKTVLGVREPEAVCLTTVSRTGIPSSRMVLLKFVDDEGFTIFTNLDSRKSTEIIESNLVAMNFYWREAHRQVRIVGKAHSVDRSDVQSYFSSRPVGSQLGAWTSPQSTRIPDCNFLRAKREEVEKEFSGYLEEGSSFLDPQPKLAKPIPAPDFWGGWKIVPFEMEFWQGGVDRLHDRVSVVRQFYHDDKNVDLNTANQEEVSLITSSNWSPLANVKFAPWKACRLAP